MKKLTLLMMACCMTFAGFAAGGNITYELNGGVTNDHGWQTKEDMYQGLYNSWNTFKGGGQTAWTSLAGLIEANGSAKDAVPKGIPTQAGTMDLTFIADATVKAEWQWLVDYLDAVSTEQAKTLPSSNAAFLRYSLSAFFFSSVRDGYPISADYSTKGNPEAFIPAWKHGFAGPATYDGETDVELPIPFKEGESFVGWYKTPDFSDERISVIPAGTTGNITLYAKFGEYIPSCKEVWEMTAGTETKVGGTVTFVKGNNAYIQDATAGLLIEFTAAPDVKAGDRITAEGTTAAVGEYVKVTGGTVEDKQTSTAPTAQTISLASLITDTKGYMFESVYMEGLKITSYDGDKAVLTDDGTNTITLDIAINQTNFPVGTLINVKAVVSYSDKLYLVGDAANVEAAPLAGMDPFAYPDRHDGIYKLANKWLISNNMDNLSANPIGIKDHVRGMLAKDGKMYFIDRDKKQLTVVDGVTGEKLQPVKLAANIFTYVNGEGETVVAGTLPFNDIKMDNAGNILLGNCITSNAGRFQIWKVDLATGAGKLIIDDGDMADRFPAADEGGNPTPYATMRFDAFGVYGDVENDGYVVAADATNLRVFKWTIKGGAVTKPTQGRNKGVISVDNETAGTYLTGKTDPGTAPQVFPISDDLFYLDGFSTLPTLIDMEGNVVDGFHTNPANQTDSITKPGERWEMYDQLNGVLDFELNGEYFLLMAATATDKTPPSAFRLFKYKDGRKQFKDLECMWTFPAAGMGTASNSYRTAVPYVDVDEMTRTAKIYLYAGENGYGVYEFQNLKSVGIKELVNNAAVNVFVDGNTLRMSEEVAQVAVFNISGQLVVTAESVSSINVQNNGIYLVKALTYSGETAIHKVIVK